MSTQRKITNFIVYSHASLFCKLSIKREDGNEMGNMVYNDP